MNSPKKKNVEADTQTTITRARRRVAVPPPPEPPQPRREEGAPASKLENLSTGRPGRKRVADFIVPQHDIPDGLAQLEALAPNTLLTTDEILTMMPLPMTRRRWVDGVRRKRYPAAVKVTSKLLYWRAGDVALCVRSLLNL